MRRLRRRLRPGTFLLALVGALFLLAVIGAAAFADLLAEHPPDRTVGPAYARPSGEHLLGTDDLGRDLWSQLLFGARVTLLVGVVAAVAATVTGTAVALIAGRRGGWVDAVAMRIVDLVLSLPFLVLVLVLAAYFGRGIGVLIGLIAGILWARPARLLRGQVLKLRELGHVVAADAMGASTARILWHHLLSRLVPLVLSQFVRAAAVAVLVQSGVAFLGLGDPDRVSWGSTLYFANNGNAILTDAWLWWIVPPGVGLTLLIVGLAFVGYAFEELAEPQLVSHGWRAPVRRRLDDDPAAPEQADAVLEMREISVDFDGVDVVRQVDLTVRRGCMLGLVGESGGGKSTLALATIGLVGHPGRIRGRAVFLGDVDLRRLGRRGLQSVRGQDIAIVPQAAMNVLDPTMTVLRQVAESAALGGAGEASAAAADLLSRAGLPPDRHSAYPHELSGGQRQRVVIAMAIANRPRLLIADEPTNGLDVVTQQQILDLLDSLRYELDLDVWLISHDLPVVASRADDLAVMYAGRIVEAGPTELLLHAPEHPYTELLLDALPPLAGPPGGLRPVTGEAPDPSALPPGCSFAPRCDHKTQACTTDRPQLRLVDERWVACHLAPLTSPADAVVPARGASQGSP